MANKQNEWTLWHYADEFFFAAEELEKSVNPDKLLTPSYYLYGHSLELAIKCFLYKNGTTLKELKNNIGHDLETALNNAKNKGIDKYICIDSAYKNVVQGLNKYYKTKELEYMTSSNKTFPPLTDVKDAVKKTLNALQYILSEHL